MANRRFALTDAPQNLVAAESLSAGDVVWVQVRGCPAAHFAESPSTPDTADAMVIPRREFAQFTAGATDGIWFWTDAGVSGAYLVVTDGQ